MRCYFVDRNTAAFAAAAVPPGNRVMFTDQENRTDAMNQADCADI